MFEQKKQRNIIISSYFIKTHIYFILILINVPILFSTNVKMLQHFNLFLLSSKSVVIHWLKVYLSEGVFAQYNILGPISSTITTKKNISLYCFNFYICNDVEDNIIIFQLEFVLKSYSYTYIVFLSCIFDIFLTYILSLFSI